MASLRKLNRRLRVWQRYDNRNAGRLDQERRTTVPPGLRRAALAVEVEDERRFWAETPEIWLGGPAGERALIADIWAPDDYETAADVEADTYPPHVVTEHGLSERGLL